MKKSQAAMESLMTYGWAVLLVAISLLGLQYFGVFDLDKHLPRQCIITQGIACLDFEIDQTNSNVKFIFKNNMGAPIENVKMSIPNCLGWNYTGIIPAGDKFRVKLLECPISDGHFKTKPQFSYGIKDVGLIHVTSAQLSDSVGTGKGVSVVTQSYTGLVDCPSLPLECRQAPLIYDNNVCYYALQPAAGSCDQYGNGV